MKQSIGLKIVEIAQKISVSPNIFVVSYFVFHFLTSKGIFV